MRLGDFVRSEANELGVGKLASQIRSDQTVEIQHLVSPAAEWFAWRAHDSPYCHTERSKFVRSVLSQRNVYRGLTAVVGAVTALVLDGITDPRIDAFAVGAHLVSGANQ